MGCRPLRSRSVPDPAKLLVSVVIPTYDRADLVSRALDALDRQTLASDRFEVVVVDNGSVDDTAERLGRRSDPFALRVVSLPHNRGPAGARNAGLAAATAPTVAFTDSDCVPGDRWLEAGLAALTPGVRLVQGRTEPDPAAEVGPWSYTQRITELNGLFETCNVFYRTADLRAVDGFDEDIGYFGEDTVAAWTVLRQGGSAAFANDALVHHEVFDHGLGWYLRWTRNYVNWPLVLRRCPELRRELPLGGWFLSYRRAQFTLGLVGLVAVPKRPWLGVALLVPYLALIRPRGLRPAALASSGRLIAFDAGVTLALVRGALRHRRIVL